MPHTWHDGEQPSAQTVAPISIHMPHTWHDAGSPELTPLKLYFNPHATYVA